MTDLHKRLTTYHGMGPKILYKQMPDGSYAEVVLTMDYGEFEEQSPLTTARLEKLPQELYYDDRDNILEIKVIDEEKGHSYSRHLRYDGEDNLVEIGPWLTSDL